jgi:Holliday junction resolvase RusA-like endonuclease
MLHRIDFDFPLMSKPRGKKGRHGNIYHNSKAYVTYKKKVDAALNFDLSKGTPWQYPIGVALLSEYIPKRIGQEPDLVDNQLGSVLDVLKEKGYIRDDNRLDLCDSIVRGLRSVRDRQIIWIFDTQSFPEAMNALMQEYEQSASYIRYRNLTDPR